MPTNTHEPQRETCRVGHSALKGTCSHLTMRVTFWFAGFGGKLPQKPPEGLRIFFCPFGCLNYLDELTRVNEI